MVERFSTALIAVFFDQISDGGDTVGRPMVGPR